MNAIKQDLALSYHLPPEWATQSGVMLTWPHQATIWADTLSDIDKVCVEIAKEITLREKLLITCFDKIHKKHIQTLLESGGIDLEKVMIYFAPSDDIWVRDHGPITVFKDNKPILLNFIFNGWGNKYPSVHDNEIVDHLAKQCAFSKAEVKSLDFVLEGGSIEVDGNGTLLTTKSCLLSKARNPLLTEADINLYLQKWFGVTNILWLTHGYLAGDDTDGHIDTLARFINPHTICYVRCDDKNDEHYTALKAMESELKQFKNAEGQPYQLIPLPWPKARFAAYDGRRLPATYANFLIINEAVLVPTYDDQNDDAALQIMADCFPDRKIIGIHAAPIIEWYGSLHCMTMQLPRGVL